ncbi:sulfatase-like hydrolase/transferase [Flavivirga spongiicola]|uniref:Phosphoglyceromutase n=1 Tax=Flavivirga spongiicola TaxID=421621 RepID=A0ABU7XTB7_9FLAO|nr:sulfatase-like hydrolase/transferase [Flavivirga sp. MEBiC05379]MDO5979027.1 phosphoglyceromutase [Flavivirga sp. MEBiC05379]
MKRTQVLTIIFSLFVYVLVAQKISKTETKVILITLDGLRWQELFSGADSLLITHKDYVQDASHLKEKFWRETPHKRREALMPFFWNEVVEMGQIHGNRTLGSKMDLTNTMWFSYPGYNEILSGKADDKNIASNDKINNPNKTVLEIINNLPQYKGKVVAFGSWDVFPYIINEERSGIPVNAGFEIAKGSDLSDIEKFLNELQPEIPRLWETVRLDAFTHHYAVEYIKRVHPKVVYISYGETDDFAHDGNYEAYLKSAHNTDALIKELWEFTEKDEFYKNNTVFIITTDHGRGTQPLETWKSHGSEIKGAGQVWMIAFGKNIKNLGEVTHAEQLYSNQIAPTILTVLNIKNGINVMKGEPLEISEK